MISFLFCFVLGFFYKKGQEIVVVLNSHDLYATFLVSIFQGGLGCKISITRNRVEVLKSIINTRQIMGINKNIENPKPI